MRTTGMVRATRAGLYRTMRLGLYAAMLGASGGCTIPQQTEAVSGDERDERQIGATTQALGAPPQSTCVSETYDGHGYWFCPANKTWANARASCQAVGTDLVNISSEAENVFVWSNVGLDALIGASDSAMEGTWKWADTGVQFWNGGSFGSAVNGQYEKWDHGWLQPDNQFNEDCALISAISGLWFDVSCSTAYWYVCEEDLCPDDPLKAAPGQCGCGTADTDTDGDGTADCNDECAADPDRSELPCSPDTDCTYETFSGSDYFFCANYRNYAAAKAKCESVGFQLARIDSAAENTFIDQQILTDRWIGGNDIGTEGTWVWESGGETFWQGNFAGAPVGGAYTHWDSGQPNNFGAFGSNCLQILANGGWNDDQCTEVEQYVCEDACPLDPAETMPGQCGCGASDDDDADADGVADCVDECPFDALKSERGQCGCGTAEADADGDSIPDCIDPCPLDDDPTLGGECGCPSTSTAPADTPCNGVCGAGVCDGSGQCGDPSACAPDATCGCISYLTTDRIYWYCPCARSRATASEACQTTPEQTLIRLETDAENAWMQARVSAPTWIGANDLTTDAEWRWSDASGDDGTRFWDGDQAGSPHYGRYANWTTGEPGGGSGSACATLSNTTGQWADESCSATRHFFCERPPFRSAPPVVNRTCELVGIPCDTGDWSECVGESTAFPEQDPAASLAACDACTSGCTGTAAECETACTNACTGSAAPPSGNATCPDLDDYMLPPGQELRCTLAAAPSAPGTCESSTECSNGEHCGWAFACQGCDPAVTVCARCDENIGCGLDGEGVPIPCVAYKACGTPIEECVLGDTTEERCDETVLCEIEYGEQTPDMPDTEDLEPDSFDPEELFGPAEEPEEHTSEYPDDPPCAGGGACSITENHNWCHYAVTEDLGDRTPSTPARTVEAGGNTDVTFSVSPDLNLNFKMAPGPLGLPMSRLSAGASFVASASIDVLEISKSIDLIDLGVNIEGGVHPDFCGVNTDGTRAIVFGMDLLPGDFEGVHVPADDADAAACEKALQAFQIAVDRAKKAFEDARELLEQYRALGPTENLEALCETYAADPPEGFPAPAVDCSLEAPEDTINRFIDYYAKAAKEVRDLAASPAFKAKLDDWFTLGADFDIGQGVSEVEEITLLNQTFAIGPIPVNLEVLLVVSYGLDIHGVATFDTGEVLASLVSAAPGHNPSHPGFMRVGAVGAPHVGAGVTLFVGIGFDVGFAAAKAGVQGSLELGHVTVPVGATAGITLGTSDDDRTLPAYMVGLVDEGAPPLLPRKKYHFGLTYDLGAELRLREILSGEISAKVKLKFFFFSKTWKRRLVKFNGLCPEGSPQSWCDIPIFDVSDGIATGEWDWGTIQMPMPFLPLKRIDALKAPGSVPFDTDRVAELFYDSLCTCIPTWESMQPDEQQDARDCFRLDDCCDTSEGHGCFHDPDDDRSKCTGCRDVAASCNEDSDCCDSGAQCVWIGDGPGTCQTGSCDSPCNDDDDCNAAAGFTCDAGTCNDGSGCLG